jgi:AcrR family transcriptional regulator
VAVEVFNVRGYDGTSMEDLAKAAGISKSSIYHHVAGKEELLRLAVTRALDGLFGVLDEPALTERRRVRPAAYVLRTAPARNWCDNLPYVTLLLRVRGNSAAERGPGPPARVRPPGGRTGQRGDRGGRPARDLDPRLTSRLIFGLVNSVSEWYRPDGPDSGPDVADALASLVLSGLRPR